MSLVLKTSSNNQKWLKRKQNYQKCKRKKEKKINASKLRNWFMLSVYISSCGCARRVWGARERRKSCSRRWPRATLTSWVLSILPACTHGLIYAQLKAWTNSFTTERQQLGRLNMFYLWLTIKFSQCAAQGNKGLYCLVKNTPQSVVQQLNENASSSS